MTKQYAKTLGNIAFANGLPCAPSMDKNFMEALNTEVGSNAEAMKAWQMGWMEANLAA